MTADSPQPPDAQFVRRRWVAHHWAEWAQECNRILREYGAVTGTSVYKDRHRARWQARHPIQLLVELDLRERREVQEHTDRKDSGWRWSVELVRSPADRARTARRLRARTG